MKLAPPNLLSNLESLSKTTGLSIEHNKRAYETIVNRVETYIKTPKERLALNHFLKTPSGIALAPYVATDGDYFRVIVEVENAQKLIKGKNYENS